MVNIPNSAKSRLRQGGGENSAHPDANLLAAFSEQALAGAEREEMLAHLAQCADCREIVALSAPEALPQPAYVPRGWFGMKPEFMRWAIVGASAAVVVAAVLLVRPELQTPVGSTRTESIATAKPPLADEREGAAAPQRKDAEQATLTAGARREREARKGDAEEARQQVHGYARDGADTAPMVTAKPSVPAAAPAAPPPMDAPKAEPGFLYAGAAAGQASGGTTAPAKGAKVAAAQTREEKVGGLQVMDRPADAAVSQNQSQDRTTTLAKEKDAARAGAVADGATKKNEPAPAAAELAELKMRRAPSESASSRMLTLRPAQNVASRTWRIADGKLESSRDGGKSWTRVDVPGGARFMAVDARPSSVWVGGTSGAVFRSPDGGVTWIEVKQGWKGDVVYLKFEDEKRGVVRTSTREEWFTEDGGDAWKKR